MNAAAGGGRLIKGATGDWEVVIGMEIHAQVSSNAKLFSGASTEFGGAPNDHVSLVDAAMPGMLPVINEHCVAQAVRTGLGLKAAINKKSVFDRKNYFYPDLPQGYQISQYKSPIVGEGIVVVDMDDGSSIEVGIERLHLEQDAGKLLHDQHPSSTYIDLNRSGVALMEIVSKPDLRSADEAMAFVAKLRTILRYLGTCDGDMEKGSLRADVNVSVRKPGAPFGTRCEIKNVNSIRFIGQAVESEARRQIDILEEGGLIDQETRLFDPGKGETRAMRSKEEAHDYRYFPDPDLLPLEFDDAFVNSIAASLPELPDTIRAKYLLLGLTREDADVIIADPADAEYFEMMIASGEDPKTAANWFINVYKGQIAKVQKGPSPLALRSIKNISVSVAPGSTSQTGSVTIKWVAPEANSAVVRLVASGQISGESGKEVLGLLIEIGPVADKEDVDRIVDHFELKQLTDYSAIERAIDEIVANNPEKVTDVKVRPQALGWFVGQVKKAMGGKADPKIIDQLIRKKLGVE